jgi:hypothetical protein
MAGDINVTIFICPSCRQQVDPEDDNVLRAVELLTVGRTFDAPEEQLEGFGVYFHVACYPGDSKSYRRTAKLTD